MTAASRVVLFDLNGTLTDISAIGRPWQAPSLGEEVLGGAVRTAMVETILGDHSDFSEHIESALRVLVEQHGLDRDLIDEALELAQALPPHPDAAAALAALRGAGARVVVLTNSGAASGTRTLEAAGLIDQLERVLGVEEVERFKPDPAVYDYAVRELGCRPDEVTLVAAHDWDVAGAKRAGLRAVWIDREQRPAPSILPQADIVARDLADAAAALGG